MNRSLLALAILSLTACSGGGGGSTPSVTPTAAVVTSSPTLSPTNAPTTAPTSAPTASPTLAPTATPNPTPSPTPTSVIFNTVFVSVPFAAKPYPSPATSINFPSVGAQNAVVIQVNGPKADFSLYSGVLNGVCGTPVSIVKSSTPYQFTITPIQTGTCSITFSDGSQSTVVTVSVP